MASENKATPLREFILCLQICYQFVRGNSLSERVTSDDVDFAGKEVYEVTVNKFRKLLAEYKSL